jgi:hypothetical protein
MTAWGLDPTEIIFAQVRCLSERISKKMKLSPTTGHEVVPTFAPAIPFSIFA